MWTDLRHLPDNSNVARAIRLTKAVGRQSNLADTTSRERRARYFKRANFRTATRMTYDEV
jgi:hypothetical protein